MQKIKSKGRIAAIIAAAISFVLALALIITNIFIPVKYLSAYLVSGGGGAAEGVMRVRFVDAGYGDCTIVELPDGKTLVIDAGKGTPTYETRILKYLNKCGIDTIDYLICTSIKPEHCGGIAELINYKKVNKIYMPYCTNNYVNEQYRSFFLAVRNSKIPTEICEYGAGEENEEYGYFFKVLSPSLASNPKGEYAEMNSNITSSVAVDNASAVIWLEYAGTGFLFTSDAGEASLTNICNAYTLGGYPVNLENCKVITSANHGHKNSACASLYDITKPEVAVFSVGDNGSGCPSAEAISDAANYAGENVFITSTHGTITVEVTKDGFKAETEKQ